MERSDDAGGSYGTLGTTTSSTFTDSLVSLDSTYVYRVTASDNGLSSIPVTDNVTTLPAAPSDLTATVAGPNEIDLNWTNHSSTATEFMVVREGSPPTPFTVSGSTTLVFHDTGVNDGTSYSYGVYAVNAGGSSATASLATPATTPFIAPTDLAVTGATATDVGLSWKSLSSQSGFAIERSSDGINYTTVSTTASYYPSTATWSGADSTGVGGATYTYRIALGSGAAEVDSPTVAQVIPFADPTNLVATENGTSQISLSWSEAASVGSPTFIVQRYDSDTAAFVTIGTPTGTTFVDNGGLTDGTTYTYRVGIEGYGSYSLSAEASTLPIAPSGVTASDGSTASTPSVTVSWTSGSANSANDSFEVYRSTDGTTFSDRGQVTGTSYTDTAVQAGGEYWYKVNALGPGNPSADSNLAVVTLAPLPPTGLTLTMVSSWPLGQLMVSGEPVTYAAKLSWTNPSCIWDSFAVYESINGGAFGEVTPLGFGSGYAWVGLYTSPLRLDSTFAFHVETVSHGVHSIDSENVHIEVPKDPLRGTVLPAAAANPSGEVGAGGHITYIDAHSQPPYPWFITWPNNWGDGSGPVGSDGTGGSGWPSVAPESPPADAPDDAPQVALAAVPDPAPNKSKDPIRYFDGQPIVDTVDLSSSGFGGLWNQQRSYDNMGVIYSQSQSSNGNRWDDTSMVHLVQDVPGSSQTLLVVSGSTNQLWYDYNPTTGKYDSRFYVNSSLNYIAGSDEYTLLDSQGGQSWFYGFSDTSRPLAQRGQLEKFVDAAGNAATPVYAAANDSDGVPAGLLKTITRSDASSGDSETWKYSYLATGVNAGLISSVQLLRDNSTTPVQQVVYSYYDGGGGEHGSANDLKSATVEDPSGNPIDTTFYGYYTAADVANGQHGFVGGIKYVFSLAGYSRAMAVGIDPATASDSVMTPYASQYFEYDAQQRVSNHTVIGLGTFLYSYSNNPNVPDPSIETSVANQWKYKTIETKMVNGVVAYTNTIYCNVAGEVILKATTDGIDPSNPALEGTHWGTFYKYDDAGQVIMTAEPSAVSLPSDLATLDQYNDVLDFQAVTTGGYNYLYLNDSSGLIYLDEYGYATSASASQAGGVMGYLSARYVQQGETGQPIEVQSMDYSRHDYTPTGSSTPLAIYPLADSTAYPSATDASIQRTTHYAYTYQLEPGSATNHSNQFATMVTTLPVVLAGQNGSGSADSITDAFDRFGNLTSEVSANGKTSTWQYDLGTGGVTQMIVDVGGLNLATHYLVDGLGRTVKQIDPDGNVTWTVYNDAGHEVRTYVGWNAATHAATGPIQVSRVYYPAANAPAGEQSVYSETLTCSATPGVNADGSPSGQETLAAGNIQSLSRTLRNNQGQDIETDDYFSLSGVTYSQALARLGASSNTDASGNYFATAYAYDANNHVTRTVSPTGTITRTLYDNLDRPVSTWVGTDDTTTTGTWSPANTAGANLLEIESAIFDNNGPGDGNLTQTSTYVGSSQSWPIRVTRFYYDWRDRQAAIKAGVALNADGTENLLAESDGAHRPISLTTYDNLDEPTLQQAFDGDGVAVSQSGSEVTVPSTALLTSQKGNSYDSQGRVYHTQTYSVDPTTGAVGNAITGNVFYDPDGNVLAVYATGKPTVKYLYDGADRLVAKYVTDGGAVDNSGSPVLTWAAAGTVVNDGVLSESDTTLDADGNAILTVCKDRLSSDAAGATGVLGTATAASRDSYLAAYYDAAGRLVAGADHGTTVVSAPSDSTPSGVPTRSDSVLLTSYGYDAAGNQDSVTDPRGIISQSYFDLLGNTTKTIAAFTDGVPTGSTNQTTAYTYDGDGHVLTMTAVMPAGQNSQTTKYVHGVGATAGTDLFSNDLIAKVEYPDLSTGAASPSAANDVSYTYDNLGEVLTKTDQNGSVHTYSHDVLGRLTLDAVTTLASGVDGTVRALGYAFNSQGLPYQQTSFSDTAATTVVNQVQEAYNGLGQLIGEYQATTGAVNTSSTPQVQYGYSSIATGSNLVSMTYPNDRILHYGYDNSALDTAIGRVDYLADDNGSGSVGTHLVDYSYLGLGTILGQAQGNGVAETTTLDGFGRVADMNYVNTASTDHFAYGYDRNGNVLYKNNLVNSSFSELYHASSASSGDSNSAYDPLNRLTGFKRGTLSSSGNNGSTLDAVSSGNLNTLTGSSQSWNLDAIGNQKSVTTDGSTVTRSANSQNELTGVGSSTLAYDHDGNTTTDETGKTLAYDAWNRLATAASGTHAVQTYTYDAQGRRISEYDAGTKTSLYLSAQSQVLEERQGTFVTAQNVWSIDYVNDLLLRDTPQAGSVDPSFGVAGVNVQDMGSFDRVTAILPQGDGRIIAVGSSGWDTLLIARYDANGQPDTTFGTDGFTEVSGPDDNAFAVCRDASGNYLVTGNDNGNIAVWRFTATGSLDTSFGSAGETVVNLGYFEYGTQIALQGNGQIVVTGFTNGPDGGLFALRLNDDGSLDTTFNTTGVRVIDLGPADGLAIQPLARSSSLAPGPMATSSASTPAMAAPILPLEPMAS